MKFAATLAFAIGLGLAAAPAQAETIKIGLQPWLGYGPLWIAEKQGFFAANGVDVQLVNFGWDADLAVALASGNINVTSIATNGVILQRNNGIDAFLAATFLGVRIPVRVQRHGELIGDAVHALYRAAKSKNAVRMILIAIEDQPSLFETEVPEGVILVSSTALSMARVVGKMKDEEASLSSMCARN